MRIVLTALCALLGTALGGEAGPGPEVLPAAAAGGAATHYQAPLDARKDGKVRFTSGPKATSAGTGVKVSFAVSAPTDVEVAVLDAKGKVIRHLAAGLLGKNAPEPLKKGSLSQELQWDRRDDLGKPAGAGPFKLRVRLGLAPGLERFIGHRPELVTSPIGLGCDRAGNLHVLTQEGVPNNHYVVMKMKIFSREGKYLRTIMPYPASLPPEKRKGAKWLRTADGDSVPMIYHGNNRLMHPGTGFTLRPDVVIRPDGRLVTTSALGVKRDRPSVKSRRLLVMGADGSVGEDYLGPVILGPQKHQSRTYIPGGFVHIALSPDGKTIYASGFRQRHGSCKVDFPVVYKTTWDAKGEAQPFIGQMGKPGDGPKQFKQPNGIAVDGKGNLYVCDYLNHRVAVFNAQGEPIGKIDVRYPDLIAVHPETGAIYVLACEPVRDRQSFGAKKLLKFENHRAKAPCAQMKLDKCINRYTTFCLDPTSRPPVLWFGPQGWCNDLIIKVADMGRKFDLKGELSPFHPPDGTALSVQDVGVNPATDELYVGTIKYGGRPRSVTARFDGRTGKFLGNVKYDASFKIWGDRYGEFTFGAGHIHRHRAARPEDKFSRFAPDGKFIPWRGLGGSQCPQFPGGFCHPRGHGVSPDGGLYLLHFAKHRDGNRASVSHVGPDGKTVRKEFIKLDTRVGGVRVDRSGNVYVGAFIKPKDEPVPKWFAGRLPEEQKWWYTHMYGSLLKFKPSGGSIATGDGRLMSRVRFKFAPKKARGLLWSYHGLSPLPSRAQGCECQTARFDVDGYGRVFVPDAFRFSITVLDANGNLISRFGEYGNENDQGGDGKIPFAWPLSVAVSDRAAYIGDLVNARVVAVKLGAAAEGKCAAP